MDRLLANEMLFPDQELVSANGWFRARLAADGSFGIYRVQTKTTIWSPMTPRQQNARLDMQADGNLVAYTSSGSPYWSSGTDRHPGACVVLSNDGDMGVFTTQNKRVWHSDSAQDLASPTIRYRGQNDTMFNETSESWKAMCSVLPCSLALQWPGYSTAIVEDVIDGNSVVIQLWKGWCPKFLGPVVQVFPGGVGGEVGIYRRIPGKVRPASLPFLPSSLEALILDSLASAADEDLWWPFPELATRVEFTLHNPVSGEVFFNAGPQSSFWLAKWMDDASYKAYAEGLGAPPTILSPWYIDGAAVPASPDGFVLDFKINGKSYPSWSEAPGTSNLSATGMLLGLC